MSRIVAIYGSPRRNGNTSALLAEAVKGARSCGAIVEEIVLRDKKISPCLEIYECKKSGECAIKDDFQKIRDAIIEADAVMIASPVFFYTVSAHVKIFMDRFQSLWVKKYWIGDRDPDKIEKKRPGLLICAGATRGKRLFEGILLTFKYFFDTFDDYLWDSILCRGLDFEDDAKKNPQYLDQARDAGRRLAEEISHGQ